MNHDTIWGPFARSQTSTKLVSIDLIKGQMRAYEATVGGKPHLQAIVDLQDFEAHSANGGFQFDQEAIEDFRLNPRQYIQEQGKDPSAA